MINKEKRLKHCNSRKDILQTSDKISHEYAMGHVEKEVTVCQVMEKSII